MFVQLFLSSLPKPTTPSRESEESEQEGKMADVQLFWREMCAAKDFVTTKRSSQLNMPDAFPDLMPCALPLKAVANAADTGASSSSNQGDRGRGRVKLPCPVYSAQQTPAARRRWYALSQTLERLNTVPPNIFSWVVLVR